MCIYVCINVRVRMCVCVSEAEQEVYPRAGQCNKSSRVHVLGLGVLCHARRVGWAGSQAPPKRARRDTSIGPPCVFCARGGEEGRMRAEECGRRAGGR